MVSPILLPVYAVFIGFCSGIIGTFYMRALPSFPLTAKWWQWGQRFETSHPFLFKWIWAPPCVYCFCGHVAWISLLLITTNQSLFSSWRMVYVWPFSICLAAASGYVSAVIFNPLYDKK